MNLKQVLSLQHTRLSGLVRLQGERALQPFLVSFCLTGSCNLRCATCQTRSTSGVHLDASLVASTLGWLRRAWWIKPAVHFIGGEPMVHPSFGALVRMAALMGFRTSVTTNGFFLPRYAKDLVAWGVDHLTVSVDGPEALHDEIRGVKGSYRAAREGVRYVREARRRRPSVAINCTIGPRNFGLLEETAMDVARWGVDSLTFQHLVFDATSLDMASAVDPDVLLAQLRALRKVNFPMAVRVFPPIRDEDLRPYYRDLSHPFGTGCVVPWVVARVYPGAEVAPCLDLYMGSLKSDHLGRIWNGPKWRAFRASRLRGTLMPGCLRCCHRRYYG